jgi:hypothetical protein
MELERTFDTVSEESSPTGTVYHARYWEGEGELEVRIYREQRVAEVAITQAGATERLRLSPLARVAASLAGTPHRLDLDRPYGGRITLWFKPLGYSVAGRL